MLFIILTQDDEYTDTSTDDSEDDSDSDDDDDDETYDEEGEDVIIEGDSWMEEERQSGDGEVCENCRPL